MRIAIAEDDPFYRAGLVKLLEAAAADVAIEAASGNELITRLGRGEAADVAILDLRMAGRDDDGLRAAIRTAEKYPLIGVLVLSAFAEGAFAERLFEHGSAGKGYMLKESLNNVAELKEALERIQQGRTYCDPKIVDMLLARAKRTRSTTPAVHLTPREEIIIGLLASGASNTAIAAKTRSSVGSTESAISAIYTKLGIPDTPDHNRRVLVTLAWLRRQSSDC